MSIEDKLAIQEMMARYSHLWDAKDADAFSQVFTVDGTFEVFDVGETEPVVRLSSRAAILDWAKKRHEQNRSSQSRHYFNGVVFDALTPDSARTQAYFLVMRQSGPDSPPTPRGTGKYHDQWQKTNEGWRFASRTGRFDLKSGFEKHWA